MARLIQLTAAHAGPTDGKIWLNADKIVKMDLGGNGKVTRVYHEPFDVEASSLDFTDVEETPAEVARKAHEPIEIGLGPVDIALTEWPRGRLAINS